MGLKESYQNVREGFISLLGYYKQYYGISGEEMSVLGIDYSEYKKRRASLSLINDVLERQRQTALVEIGRINFYLGGLDDCLEVLEDANRS